MTSTSADTLVAALSHFAARLRILSVRATTEAGSGHPTSCCSAADIVATLFFSVMRFDPRNPKHPNNDRFVLSKGHAAPLLYAAWAEAGAFNPEELLRLRTLDSDLEGHPTPRLNFVDVATGSLSPSSWTRLPRRPGRKTGPRSSWPARSRARGSRSLKTSRTGTANP